MGVMLAPCQQCPSSAWSPPPLSPLTLALPSPRPDSPLLASPDPPLALGKLDRIHTPDSVQTQPQTCILQLYTPLHFPLTIG